MDFVQLAQNRYSVREYASKPVSQDLLDKVYEVSMKTPSVCNRQATRVYQITYPEKIATALKIQGGFNGYGMLPVLLLITSDIRAFMNNNERNEPFVDGLVLHVAAVCIGSVRSCGLPVERHVQPIPGSEDVCTVAHS